MPNPAITPARPEDLPLLAAIWEDAVRATHHFLQETDIRMLRPLIETGYLPAMQVFCCRDGSANITGFIGIDGDRIEMLFIDPRHHRHGYGRLLLRHALSLGADKVDVNEQNPAALAFYQAQGFAVFDRSAVDGQGNPFPILHMMR